MKYILYFAKTLEMNKKVGNELTFKNEPKMRNPLEMNPKNELEMNQRFKNERRCRNEPMIYRRNER